MDYDYDPKMQILCRNWCVLLCSVELDTANANALNLITVQSVELLRRLGIGLGILSSDW